MTTAIDLNKIRSLKTLEAIRKPLIEFVAFDPAIMRAVYTEEFGWGEDDYEADKEQASDLLEQVERRMKSLGRHLSRAQTASLPASQTAVS